MKAKTVSSTEFERHTLVSVDRYLAYKPREEKINTLNDLSKIRKVRMPGNDIRNMKSDLDIHIDWRYGLAEFHHVKNRLFARVILNSQLHGKLIDPFALVKSWCVESSRDSGAVVEYSRVQDDEEEFVRYSRGTEIERIAGGSNTFDKVLAMHDFAIGHVMKVIDENVDVLIAPRLVRELEGSIVKAKDMLKKLQDLGIKDERMERDNISAIRQSENLLETVKEDMYKDVTVEEVHFKLTRAGEKI